MAKNLSTFVARPLEGLAVEASLVAMREILPAAVATARLSDPAASPGGEVRFVTVLPELARSWRQADGVPVVALQPPRSSDDVSQDLGNALTAALAAEEGQPAEPAPLGHSGPKLQDLVDPDGPTTFELRQSFDFWADLNPSDSTLVEAAAASADELAPTAEVPGLAGAYWARLGEREYLRWSLGLEEEPMLDALARLQAAKAAGVMDGAKYAGAFRALGLVIPVWDLPRGTEAADLAEPGAEFKDRLDAALAARAPLDAAARRARAGLVARSLTLR
ncbi:MAG: DUF5926 family protein [Bifidobacteriaceae bacterium]|jgi:hypothetical protein|nr:DUF5926 family protein [Bifidobacteriaceae bacterium]